MPELPEVQTVVDTLNQCGIVGRTIDGARVRWPKTIAGDSPAGFCRRVQGCRILRITRRGKYIVLCLSGGFTLLIHLRMTGRLNWTRQDRALNAHEHVILKVGPHHELRFQDTRKFGRIVLTDAPEAILGKLGPEPLGRGFTRARFFIMLQARKRQLKPLLLDQTFLVGLGNIYVDEALWLAGIHPCRRSDSLDRQEADALHRAIRKVLNQGLKNEGTSLGSGQGNFHAVGDRPGKNADKLNVFRRTATPCPRCNTTIERIIVGQRSSHICPVCQKMSG
ncbi:DNA-formamidopyrimidine glycosylase [uncultured Desulfosarcina sp.]|uniref:DNA-formamidopyrimidine glycosylase n=1 Tax=uncultured Desulfosarcina sp. TaxID=218289 RepID=UPI0029C77D8B|nr:DNA-formamidopyrimidine glycosylase [uncultured Desulfosarcina sp.]